MDALCKGFPHNPQYFLHAIPSLPSSKFRKEIAKILLKQMPSHLLFSILLSGNRIVECVSSRSNYSLHPDDAFLLLNLIQSSKSLQTNESWIPLCLPKFNDAGFLYCYISPIAPGLVAMLLSPNKEAFFDLREHKNQLLRVRFHLM